jgi:legumain
MKLTVLLSLILLTFISCDNFAVLVAGSNTYSNYRHQSDVFHHYHILVDRGINPDNIIVFAYDDIANNARNPFPGKVFNSPKGVDVYAGVVIDYYGEDVTPKNFLAAITGDADGLTIKDSRTNPKVLTSTENDNVYFFFSDHGSDKLIAFPSVYLYADELNAAFQTMFEKKMYKELVFYLEACHSGSMFHNLLPNNISIYTTTAANPDESSYADYCSSQARINGTLIGSCLGDEYSCRFMEDIDSRPGDALKDYTMQQQYEYLVKAVTGSHVMQYGDLEIAKKSIYYFVNAQTKRFLKFVTKTIDFFLPIIFLNEEKTMKINNENYRLEWYRMQAEETNDMEAENEYYEEVAQEGRSTKIFEIFRNWFNLPKRNHDQQVDFDCYRKVVSAYENKCGMVIDRDFKFMTHIANFCAQGIYYKKAEQAFAALCEDTE